MIQQIYKEQDLPHEDLQKIGLVKKGRLILDKDDLQAMLSGRRTDMLRLEKLELGGFQIPALDVKLSLSANKKGKPELLLHPIYREAAVPQFLSDAGAEALRKGEVANIQQMTFDDEGNPREILVEYDKDTNEFIITDTERILVPDVVNSEVLSREQKERYRKGKEVELSDGTKFQYSGTGNKGISSNKLALVASILIDGGVSYVLFKGLNALFGEKKDEKSAEYSKGYYDALADMEAEEQETSISR